MVLLLNSLWQKESGTYKRQDMAKRDAAREVERVVQIGNVVVSQSRINN